MSLNSGPLAQQSASDSVPFVMAGEFALDGDHLGAKAIAIHRLGRLRAKHFPTMLLADDAMGLLLLLFAAERQGVQVSDRTLALANQLARDEANTMITRLVHAGLLVISGDETERRSVGLTPIGSARVRGFVNDHPAV